MATRRRARAPHRTRRRRPYHKRRSSVVPFVLFAATGLVLFVAYRMVTSGHGGPISPYAPGAPAAQEMSYDEVRAEYKRLLREAGKAGGRLARLKPLVVRARSETFAEAEERMNERRERRARGQFVPPEPEWSRAEMAVTQAGMWGDMADTALLRGEVRAAQYYVSLGFTDLREAHARMDRLEERAHRAR